MKRFLMIVCVFMLCMRNMPFAFAVSIGTDIKVTAISEVGTPISSLAAETLKKGSWSLGQRNEYYKLRSYSDQEIMRLSLQNGVGVESNDYFYGSILGAAYGLTDDLTVGVILPFSHLANIRSGRILSTDEVVVDPASRSHGVGDLTILGLWQLFDNKSNHFAGLLIFGTNAPTGVTQEKNAFGDLLTPTDQPGTGAWSPYAGIAFTKRWDKLALSTSVIYTRGRRGAQDTNQGDDLSYNLALVRRWHTDRPSLDWDVILELNGERIQKANVAGVGIDSHTGGNIISFSPGLRVTTKGGFSPYVAVGLPIHQKLNGVQSAVRYSIVAGIDFNID